VDNAQRRPAGISVGRALRIRAGFALDLLREVVAAIDAVHGDGDLPEIEMTLQSIWPREGRLVVDPTTGAPVAIAVDKDEPSRLAALHEIGHFLDYVALGSPNRFASNSSRLLQSWRQSVRASQAVLSLALMRERGVVDVHNQGGTYDSIPVRMSYVRYLLTYNELWARSYAQFVAVRNGQSELMAELNDRRTERRGVPYYPRFWQDVDFEPIAESIESLFRRFEWIV
jgi:hypothetical protein